MTTKNTRNVYIMQQLCKFSELVFKLAIVDLANGFNLKQTTVSQIQLFSSDFWTKTL